MGIFSKAYRPSRRFLFNHELTAAMGAGNKSTSATKGAALEIPLTKAFAAMPGKIMEGKMNFKNTNANPESKTLTHHGHSTSRLSKESSLRPINCHSLSHPTPWSGVLELFRLVKTSRSNSGIYLKTGHEITRCRMRSVCAVSQCLVLQCGVRVIGEVVGTSFV